MKKLAKSILDKIRKMDAENLYETVMVSLILIFAVALVGSTLS